MRKVKQSPYALRKNRRIKVQPQRYSKWKYPESRVELAQHQLTPTFFSKQQGVEEDHLCCK